MDPRFDDDQVALLAAMHALLLRRGTEAVAAVVQKYHPDVGHIEQQLLISGQHSSARSVSPPLSSTSSRQIPAQPTLHSTTSKTPYKGGSVPTTPKTQPGSSLDYSTRRNEKDHAQPSSSLSPRPSSSHPPGLLSLQPRQHSARPLKQSTSSSSRPQQQLQYAFTPTSPVHRKQPSSLSDDTPPTSPVPDSPPPSPVPEHRLLSPIPNLSDYVQHVKLEHVPADVTRSIHQHRATGPQDRWYCVIRGRQVGVFNNWTDAGHSVSGIQSNIHHRADSESSACEGFLKALREGKVVITYRLAKK